MPPGILETSRRSTIGAHAFVTHTPLGPGREFDAIRRFWSTLGDRAAGGGDDCAFIELDGTTLAVSCDLSIEGTHFRLGWLKAHEIGWRACAASLSDLAAVAATPVGILAAVGLPREMPASLAVDLMDGVAEAAHAAGCGVVGGDLVRSDAITIDVVSLGRGDHLVRRVGAQPGDTLWITGALGGPAAALAAWEQGQEPEETARARFARPEPRIAAAQWLAARGARAMIDVSDGLLADAAHLAAASGVRCAVERERVPVHPAATVDQAIVGGEEYELLVALPASVTGDVGARFADAHGFPLTRVGAVDAGDGVVLWEHGGAVAPPVGFGHFD